MLDEKRIRKASGATVPPAPERCSVAGCDGETAVQLLCVWDGGKRIVATAGELMTHKGVLREGLEFSSWLTRCAACYDREINASGKGHLDMGRLMREREEARARAAGVLAAVRRMPEGEAVEQVAGALVRRRVEEPAL